MSMAKAMKWGGEEGGGGGYGVTCKRLATQERSLLYNRVCVTSFVASDFAI